MSSIHFFFLQSQLLIRLISDDQLIANMIDIFFCAENAKWRLASIRPFQLLILTHGRQLKSCDNNEQAWSLGIRSSVWGVGAEMFHTKCLAMWRHHITFGCTDLQPLTKIQPSRVLRGLSTLICLFFSQTVNCPWLSLQHFSSLMLQTSAEHLRHLQQHLQDVFFFFPIKEYFS